MGKAHFPLYSHDYCYSSGGEEKYPLCEYFWNDFSKEKKQTKEIEMKQEFEITQEEIDDIIAIRNDQPPVMKFGDHWSGLDLQEKINAYWETLGKKYGFDDTTVAPSGKGKLFVLAEAKNIKTPEEIELEKYDTLEKIVKQLESCNFQCPAGSLKNNAAFRALKKMA